MTEFLARVDILGLLVTVAFVTYLTRSFGYLVLSRFSRIPPRLEAALDAVPAAVITALVIPPAIYGGPAELAAIAVAGIAAFRYSPLPVLAAGLGTLVALRAVGL